MDSRQLYKAAEHLGITLIWDKNWIYFGTANNVKYALINELIEDFLQSEYINFVYERRNSGAIEAAEILSAIKDLLGKSNFELWNDSMDRAIKFNCIGVLLKGQKTTYNN